MQGNLAYQETPWDELINGKLVAMSPRPSLAHNMVAGNIYRIFANYLKGKRCTPFADGTDLYLTEKDRFVPDMMVVCDPDKLKPNGVYGAPDLVVEVLSPSTAKNDRRYKKDIYEKSGVLEYWIVSPNDKTIERYLPEGGRLVLESVYVLHPDFVLANMPAEEQAALVHEFKCSLFDDLLISVADIFDRLN